MYLGKDSNEKYKLIEVEGSEKIWPCDLALLALGFTGPENLIFKDLKTEMNESSKPITNDYQTTNPKVLLQEI